ncbi:MAG: ATPase RavA stimulator ViaA [Aeromonadaceae bacterium]
MMELQTLTMLLSFSEADLLKEVVGGIMASPQMMGFMRAKPKFEAQIREHLGRWSSGLSAQIQHAPAPPELEQEFLLYQETHELPPEPFRQHEPRLICQLQRLSPFHAEAISLLENLKESNPLNRKQLFLQKWRESLVNRIMALELELAEQERERMLKELEQRLEIASEVEQTLNPQNPGKLWDLSSARLLQGDSRRLRHYAHVLAKNPELQRIAAELGRMAHQNSQSQERLSQREAQTLQYEKQQDVPDDLVGVHQSNQLNRLLSSEAMLLTSPELETIFYKHLVERRLLNYHFMGQSRSLQKSQVEHYLQGEEPLPKGPFIVCIDTSGSMSGYPEETAKALCFALLQIALSEGRECIIQLFSTEVMSYELTGPSGLQEALSFLGCSFKGGTDLAPCFGEVLSKMQQASYENADAIVLSDFIAQRLPAELIEQVERIKQQGNRFNAVCLSRHGKPALMKIFDGVWQFDTGLSGRLLRRLR